MSQVQRKFSWLPDVPDHRDHFFKMSPPTAGLPTNVLPLGLSNRIEDQGDLGSCVGNAATSALEIVTRVPNQLSRLMAYYNARAIEGSVPYDYGCYIRDAIKAFKASGCCAESLWPYNIAKFAQRPPMSAYTDARKIQPLVLKYERVTTLTQVKTAIAAGFPVVFGFMVPAYFVSNQVATNGWVRFPTAQDQQIGGHAVLAVGYDSRLTASPKPYVWVRNSWGTNWGLKGYFKMEERWFTDPSRLVDDMWVIYPK